MTVAFGGMYKFIDGERQNIVVRHFRSLESKCESIETAQYIIEHLHMLPNLCTHLPAQTCSVLYAAV